MTLNQSIQKRIDSAIAAAAKIGQPHDFFDFISVNRTIRTLHPAAFTRFMECRPLNCPECGLLLPLNATPDDYLHCAFCSTYWDLLKHRPVVTETEALPQIVLPL